MSSVNLLFYSNKCEASKHFLSMLENENLVRFFQMICTDNNINIPPQIVATPTIIIRGIQTPYVGANAFSWLAKVKQWKLNITMQKINLAQKNYLQNINGNLACDNNNLLGFSKSEMNSMSDIFSFFSKRIEQECQESFPQSYTLYENIGKEFIETIPINKDEEKIKPNAHARLKNNLESERKKQDNIFKQSIDNFRNQYIKKN